MSNVDHESHPKIVRFRNPANPPTQETEVQPLEKTYTYQGYTFPSLDKIFDAQAIMMDLGDGKTSVSSAIATFQTGLDGDSTFSRDIIEIEQELFIARKFLFLKEQKEWSDQN